MTLLYWFFGLLAIYVIGIIYIYMRVMRERDSWFTIGKQRSIALFLGFIWPYMIYMHIRGKW